MNKKTVESSRPEINEEFQGDIDRIMRNFDFEKVLKVMRLLNWQWAQRTGGMRTPTMEEIKSSAERKLIHVSKLPVGNWLSSGGFTAEKSKGEFGVQLRLTFELCSWDGKDFQV